MIMLCNSTMMQSLLEAGLLRFESGFESPASKKLVRPTTIRRTSSLATAPRR